MQYTVIAILLLTSINAHSQDIINSNFPTKDSLIQYSGVINVDSSLSSNDLYLNAKKWIVESFHSGKAVTQIDDKDHNILMIKAYLDKGDYSTLGTTASYKFWFTLKIETKPGRYKYTLENVWYEAHVKSENVSADVNEPFEAWLRRLETPKQAKKREEFYNQYNQTCASLDKEFKAIILSLEKSMKQKAGSDW